VLVTALLTGLGLGFDDDVHPATITITPVRAISVNMWYFFIFPSPTEVFLHSLTRIALPVLSSLPKESLFAYITALNFSSEARSFFKCTKQRRVLQNVETQRFHRGETKKDAGYMAIDIQTLATANLVVQLVLVALVLGAVYFARRGMVIRHCTIVRGTVVVQIITIFAIMLPSLLGYVESVPPIPFLYPELLIHHILGLVLIAIFIYINLEVGRVIRPIVKRKNAMRTALGVWLVTIALGITIYLTVYYA
jgi:uncharacterized membrane protein YozB (DUF420 family)